MKHVRRFRDGKIITYLRCEICGAMQETMIYNMETGEVTTP